MVRTLEQAIAQLARLPEADQEQIGYKILTHVEKLNTLRAEIDKGLRSLDADERRTVNIEDLLREKHQRLGRDEVKLGSSADAGEVHLFHGTLADPEQWPPTAHAHVTEQVQWFEINDHLPRYAATSGKGAKPVRRGPKRRA